MKLADIKIGMKLRGVGTYADECIIPGGEYVVSADADGNLQIMCGAGSPHELKSTADKDGNIPELEPLV